MADFLSPEWVAELDEAARASSTLAAVERRFVMEQRVTGAPDGDRCYHFVVGDGPARVRDGAAPSPDVTLVVDRETARALHDGSENAQAALAAGRLRIRGSLDAILLRAGALAALDDVFRTVRSRTGAPDDRQPRPDEGHR